MPPSIALTFCFMFIIILLLYDTKRENKASSELWVPTIWFLVIASRPVNLILNPAGMAFGASEEGNLINQIVDATLIALSILILFRRKPSIHNVVMDNKYIFIFYLFCGISILWSDYPFVSLKRYIKSIGNILIIFILFTESDPVSSINTVIRRCAYVFVPLSICLIKYFPLYGRAYNQWTGELMITGAADDKNALGRICMVLCLFYSWQLLYEIKNNNIFRDNKEKIIHISILIMTIWMLIKAHSATAIFCFTVGFITMIVLKAPFFRERAENVIVYIAITALVLYFIDYLFNIREFIVVSLGRNMTFTERDILWKTLWNMDTDPLIGTGFESFWLGDRFEYVLNKLGYGPIEAHNGYLEIYLNLGIIGGVLFVALIISCYLNIRKKFMENYNFSVISTALFVVFLFYNITESATRGTYILWTIFLVTNIDYKCLLPIRYELNDVSIINETYSHFI